MELTAKTLRQKKETARKFAAELKAMGEHWEAYCTNTDYVQTYLEDDLKRFPAMLREEMLRRGAFIA